MKNKSIFSDSYSKPLVASTLLSCLISSTNGYALQVEEVIVTAQKREQSANDISVAVSAFSGDDLAEIGVVDTRDLANLIPGFSFADSGQNSPIYSLRGIGFNEKSQTASSTVGVYIDEVGLPFPVMTKGANLDLERVEVLKGPQGTLYGRNTTGGAINYISRKPTDTLEAGVTASYGSYQTSDIEFFISGPITEDLGVRLAVRNIYAGEGWQKSLSRTLGTQYQTDVNNGDALAISSNPFGFNDTLGEKDKQAARLKLEWHATDTVTINSSIEWWQDNSELQAGQPFKFAPQSPFLSPDNELPFIGGTVVNSLQEGIDNLHPEVLAQPLANDKNIRYADWPVGNLGVGDLDISEWRVNDEFLMGTFRSDWDFSDEHTLTVLTAYADFNSDDSRLPSSGLASTNQDVIQNVSTELFSLELRIAGDNGSDTNWVAGLFYSTDQVTEVDDSLAETTSAIFNTGGTDSDTIFGNLIEFLNTNLGPLGVTVPDPVPLLDVGRVQGDQETTINAIFGNIEHQYTDEIKFSLGMRYTDEERQFEGCTRDSPLLTQGLSFIPLFSFGAPLINGGLTGPQLNLEFGDCVTQDAETGVSQLFVDTLAEDNISGRFAVDWTPTDDVLIYGSFSRGFKSGSYPILTSSTSAQLEPATQEKLDAFEIGTKSTLLDGLMQLNSAAFYYDYTDKQLLASVSDPIFGQLPQLQNAPESEVKGIELDIQYSPIDGLYIGAAAAYIKTKIKRYEGVNELGEDENFAGNPFNFSPELSYTLLINYSIPIGNNELTFGVDYAYTDDTSASLSSAEDFKIDSYSIVNTRVSFGSYENTWKVSVWGRNITNEFYVNSIINPGDALSRYTGMPETYGVTLSYNYY